MPVRAAIAVALLILLGYGAVEAWPLVAGPTIEVRSPAPETLAEGGRVTVIGTATHTETLWLNGGPLLIDEDGNFEAALVLPEGGAILSLTATDRFGHEKTERLTVYVP